MGWTLSPSLSGAQEQVVLPPVLKFSEFNKHFEVHMDASEFAIGGVLMQDGQPIAYESKKFDGC